MNLDSHDLAFIAKVVAAIEGLQEKEKLVVGSLKLFHADDDEMIGEVQVDADDVLFVMGESSCETSANANSTT